MSRGLGTIERAVATAFIGHPERAFSVAQLVEVVYPRATQITKSHRVAVIRAADNVAGVIGWQKKVGGSPREARYARSYVGPMANAAQEISAGPAALQGPADALAERVAQHLVAFLRTVLDPASVASFVGELDRTSVDHLRRQL